MQDLLILSIFYYGGCIMYILYYLALEASSVILLVPAFFILNRKWLHDRKKTAVYWMISCYIACVYALVGLPNVTYIRFEPNVNWIPLIGIPDDLKNCLLNIVWFLPLGFLFPLLCDRFQSIKSVARTGFLASLSIEFLQIFSGRTTDVNDLITNSFGAVLGFLLAHFFVPKRPVINGTVRELGLVSGFSVGVMFFVQPFLTRLIWTVLL